MTTYTQNRVATILRDCPRSLYIESYVVEYDGHVTLSKTRDEELGFNVIGTVENGFANLG